MNLSQKVLAVTCAVCRCHICLCNLVKLSLTIKTIVSLPPSPDSMDRKSICINSKGWVTLTGNNSRHSGSHLGFRHMSNFLSDTADLPKCSASRMCHKGGQVTSLFLNALCHHEIFLCLANDTFLEALNVKCCNLAYFTSLFYTVHPFYF